MADKTVLSMKAASPTGDVRVMHSVPHTLEAVGLYSYSCGLKEATRCSKDFLNHANQTVGKPANYLGINMLVELDSRQEITVPTGARGQVFQNFHFHPRFIFFQVCTEI